MSKKAPKKKKTLDEVVEPAVEYQQRKILVFNSFEEQEEYELNQMALLSPEETLQQLRMMVNRAYGVHGYNPDQLPKKSFY